MPEAATVKEVFCAAQIVLLATGCVVNEGAVFTVNIALLELMVGQLPETAQRYKLLFAVAGTPVNVKIAVVALE